MHLTKHLLFAILLVLLCDECKAQRIDDGFNAFMTGIATLKASVIRDIPSDLEFTTDKVTARASRPEDSWASIIRLWAAGERDYLELLWWRKDDRETRALIVSLYWCNQPPPREDAQQWPASVTDFSSHARRFAFPEQEQRLEETRFVRRHLSAIAMELSEVVRKINSSKATQMARRYSDVAKMGEGIALPRTTK